MAAIDVLIPVYNAADTLDETLASLCAQTMGDFRVVAIDDGSSDMSARILADWMARDSRFTYLTTANGGIVAALNRALALAEAPLVARLDADDLCAPDRLEWQSEFLAAHPDAVAVGGQVKHIDAVGAPVSGLPQAGDPGLADPNRIPAREPYIVHPFLTARTEAMRGAGGYRNVPHSEDSDLFWRLRDRGSLHNPDRLAGQYRMHGGSISGGSVVNGRVMAVGSQLGALAARRRAAGEDDEGFGDDLITKLTKAETLDAMCAIVVPIVGAAERDHFRLACAIKLLELAAYRPYEIDSSDAVFIADALRDGTALTLPDGNREEIRWYATRAAARLMRDGKLAVARRLLPPKWWPMAIARTAV